MIAETLTARILARLGLMRPLDHHHKVFEAQREKCESPIEIAFWNTAYFELSKLGDFAPQIPTGPYRLDFALTEIPDAYRLKVAIEIDGHDYHKTKAQRDHDTSKDRFLQRQGWKVVRFTGSQVYQDTGACVVEAKDLIKQWIYWEGYRR